MRGGSEANFEGELERVGWRVEDEREEVYGGVKVVDGGNDVVNEGIEAIVVNNTFRFIFAGIDPVGEGSLGLDGLRAILIPLLGLSSACGNIWTSFHDELKHSLLARRSSRVAFVLLIRELSATIKAGN